MQTIVELWRHFDALLDDRGEQVVASSVLIPILSVALGGLIAWIRIRGPRRRLVYRLRNNCKIAMKILKEAVETGNPEERSERLEAFVKFTKNVAITLQTSAHVFPRTDLTLLSTCVSRADAAANDLSSYQADYGNVDLERQITFFDTDKNEKLSMPLCIFYIEYIWFVQRLLAKFGGGFQLNWPVALTALDIKKLVADWKPKFGA